MDRVFKSLWCVVYYLVQDYCIGVHNGLFIVIAWWCILDCSVKFQIREGSKKELWIERSSHCAVLCTIWFKIIALVCMNGLLIVTAWWGILDCLVQVQSRGRSKKEQCIECSSLCAVLCTIGFKIMALVCIMNCSRLQHDGAYWIIQWFVYRLFAVIVWKCTLEFEDFCIEMHDGLFTITA